jgi:N-acetylglucosamine malate deacetylase 2
MLGTDTALAFQPARVADRFVPSRDLRVLAVTARPGQESAELGGLLSAFRRAGSSTALLCLTRGEASPLNSTSERLETIRPWELQVACGIVGISSVMLSDFPDGGLSGSPVSALIERVERAIGKHRPDLLVITDPAGGSPDDARVAEAACHAARRAGLPVAARTVPGALDSWPVDLGGATYSVRAAQRSAVAAHVSQSGALNQVHAHLGSLGGREWLRWLAPPEAGSLSEAWPGEVRAGRVNLAHGATAAER